MARISGAFTAGNMFMVVIIAVMGVYLWGQFTSEAECTQAKFDAGDCDVVGEQYTIFGAPDDLDKTTLWVIRLLIIGGAVYLGYSVVTKLSGKSVGRRDVMTLILLGVAVYFIWEYVLSKIMDADTLAEISFKTAKKLGLG